MAALTTLFTPASWCSDRFVVFIDDHALATSIIPPSSGWIDPSFTECIPTQYTTPYPTFSPGVCPVYMQIVKHTFDIHDESGIDDTRGFTPMSIDPEYLCTSSITSPMAFLLDPDVSTADVYTTLTPGLWIEHDQVTVQWELSDLELFPANVASQYKLMMDITAPPATDDTASETTEWTASQTSATTAIPTPVPTLATPISRPTTSNSRTSSLPLLGSETESRVKPTNDGELGGIVCRIIFALILFNMRMRGLV
ncbi:hypothetical protein E0Z10_g4986 [Xylaria hypoxylon]|uniref:Uncharacterized protein n=1 Tax=Xylaria hypoxylon TaxID=37992 RepID=A0A4Z0YIP7_9PEZI|nr:hypothetical protein E0Z10_g4986 [Xylaria hypoxylon]